MYELATRQVEGVADPDLKIVSEAYLFMDAESRETFRRRSLIVRRIAISLRRVITWKWKRQ